MSTLKSIAGSGNEGISIDFDPTHGWHAYIPPTRPEHFDGYEAGWFEALPEAKQIQWLQYEAPILAPWGDTYWPTLIEAIEFVGSVANELNIQFNNGEVAR